MKLRNKRLIWRCRRWLPQRNAVHRCRPEVPVATHFRGKDPKVRQLYQAVRAALSHLPPRTPAAPARQKSRSQRWRCLFRLTHPKEIDRAFRRLLAQAYQVGQQKHLDRLED